MQWFLTFLHKVRAWGLPFHGLARDSTLTTDVGDKAITLPHKPYAGEVVLVQHPKYQAVSNPAFFSDQEKAWHTANGYEWREYALLAGRNRMLGGYELYPIPDPPGSAAQPTVKKWIYCDANQSWIVGITVTDYDDYHYDLALYLYDRLVITAGPDRVAPTPRLLATRTVTFLSSLGTNAPTSAIANPSLVMTHSRTGAKTAVNVFPWNCYQENDDLYFSSPVVSHNQSSPHAEYPFVDVFGCYASLKVEIVGNGDKASAILGEGIIASITVDKVVEDMVNAKTAEHSYDINEEYDSTSTSDSAWPITAGADGANFWTIEDVTSPSPLNDAMVCEGIWDDTDDWEVTSTIAVNIYWSHYDYYSRHVAGTYYGGWSVAPLTSGKTYWELDVDCYLYVDADGVYSYPVAFSGWSGYRQTITAYTADNTGPITYTRTRWYSDKLADGYFDLTGSGQIGVTKAMSYLRGTVSTLTVFGKTLSNENTYTYSWTENSTWGVSYSSTFPCRANNASIDWDANPFFLDRSTVYENSAESTSSGDVPEAYAFPGGEPADSNDYPIRIGWYLGFLTPTIIDIWYRAMDGEQAPVYVKSIAVNGTEFNRYIDGEYRRATYDPVAGTVAVAADGEQHICYV